RPPNGRAAQLEERLLMAVSFRPLCAPKRASARRKPPPWRARPVVERLEDRTLLSAVLVKDINRGPASSDVGSTTAFIGSTIYFAANDGKDGSELWKTDGTKKGTVMVADINPGPGGSNPTYFMEVNGQILFVADDGTHGRELWKTD